VLKMKRIPFKALAAAIACTTLLASCGGGDDDDAGSITPFGVTPDSIDVTGPNDTSCGAGFGGDVLVSGGTAPYRVVNLIPGYVSVDRTTVDDRNKTFAVTFSGLCFEEGQVVVIDALDRQVTLTLSNTEGEEQ
jgi:hypothetical protein